MDLDKMVHYDTELDLVEKMYAANLSPETGAQIQVNGRGEIGFSCQDGYTKLSHLYQHDPVRVLFPDVPSEVATIPQPFIEPAAKDLEYE